MDLLLSRALRLLVVFAAFASTSGFSDTTGLEKPRLDSEEQAFVTLINEYRTQNGLEPLQVSLALTLASRWMSRDMATRNYFSHIDLTGRDPFIRMAELGYAQSAANGENIAAGHESAQETFIQWRNSPGHNANMLGSTYHVIGVGRVYDSNSAYGWYWTTDFGARVDKLVE